MDMHEVVMKLIGPIDPVGESHADERSFENLKALTDLVDRLVGDIDRIASYCKSSGQFSVKRSGEHCDKFLTSLGIVE